MKNKISEEQYIKMTTAPIGGLILSLGIPSMVTMLINSIYNLADTFFVGQIGTSATAAVGVIFSLNMFLMALGFWAGTGGSTLVSKLLGAQENDQADRIASTSVALSGLFGVVIALVGLLGGNPLLRLLGATETILPYARTYARFILLAGPFSASSLAMAQLLRAEGLSRESMVGQVAGGVLNMVLDPLFIFGFGWGIGGAAAATAISQVISWVLLYWNYFRKRTSIKLSISCISREIADYVQIFRIGFPSLCRHGCNMLANIVLNTVSGNWGDAAIAAMSICSRLLYLSNAVANGLNQGSQPVIGFAYGQKNFDRVKKTFWFAAKLAFLSMCAFAVVGLTLAPQLIGIFRDDPEVIRVGSTALRFICLALPFASFASAGNILFQMVEQPGKSSLLIFGRQLGVYIPALLILPRLLGLTGMQMSGPISDVIMGMITFVMVKHYFGKELGVIQ